VFALLYDRIVSKSVGKLFESSPIALEFSVGVGLLMVSLNFVLILIKQRIAQCGGDALTTVGCCSYRN
jgi:hypothetical protein